MSKGKVGGLLSQDPVLMWRILLQRSVSYWRHPATSLKVLLGQGKSIWCMISAGNIIFLIQLAEHKTVKSDRGKVLQTAKQVGNTNCWKRCSGRPRVGAHCPSPQCWLLSHHSTQPGCSHTLCQRPKKIHIPVNTRKNEGNWQNSQIIKTARI